MSSNYIHQDYSNPNFSRYKNNRKELPNINRFNFNNKNIKLNIIPHSLSQNKNLQYHQPSNVRPKIIEAGKFKNYHHFYEKENSKKSESSNNTTFNNNIIEIKDILGKNANKPIDLEMLSEDLPKFNPRKISSKSFGIITSYAANTNQGIVRNYNEDRVSIIINMNKPNNYKSPLPWPKISYFAIFDGHAGNKCAEYLRENLLKLICSSNYFPENIPEAIRFGFEKADEQFLNNYAMINGQLKDNSGTCGLILLIINDDVYIGNVGDSRCIGSFNNGKIQRDITRDHKPNAPYEKERIISNGGQIYQTKTNIKVEENLILKNKILLGPYRVFPGRLSVSRTVGDAEGKIPILGGNPNVIICEPDIYKFNIIENDIDFFILGCDGIYDQLTSKDVFKCVSLVLDRNKKFMEKIEYSKINKNQYNSIFGNDIDIHSTCGDIVDLILKAAMIRQSYDNVTCLIINFKNLLDNNYIYNNDNTLENTKNRMEIYSSIKREPKILMTSNSSNNYQRNSSSINKKNINIHGISKIIQKLRSGNSDSSLFKKKEEIAIENEINEYSKKPTNISLNKHNKNNKDNSILDMHHSQSNGHINITEGNSLNHSINNRFKYREEKKNAYINSNIDDNNDDVQIIYKNNNHQNIFYKPNKILKTSNSSNSITSFDNDDLENKNEKIFYNKKRINYNAFKKRIEPPSPKYSELEKEKEIKKDIENDNVKQNRTFIISNNNSRNMHTNKPKRLLNLNNFIYTNNNNSYKNLTRNDEISNFTESNSLNKNISTSLKALYNKKDENDKNNYNYKYSNNNIIDKNNDNNEKTAEEIIENNFLTETKVRANRVFHNLIKNKSNKINLLQNFNKINPDSGLPGNSSTIKQENDDKNMNKNISFQAFKAFKSIGIKKINPSPKNSFILKDKKNENINNDEDYNNHKYLFSNNNNRRGSKNQEIKEKYDTYNNINKNNNKIIEPRYSNNRNHKELKVKYSSSQLRSNTDYNYKEKNY